MNQQTEQFFHKSVLVDEVIQYLALKPGGVYVDATFGSGGHTRAILKANPTITVISIDWDINSLDKYAPALYDEFGKRFISLFGNFGHLYKLIKKTGHDRVDGILADFGTSQMQIVERDGFSIYRDTPLDMRMSTSHHQVTASQIVNTASEYELADIFWRYGEERFARKIAAAIVHDRTTKSFKTTKELAQLIERIIPREKRGKIHPATRVFQALRIVVNQELENIQAFLKGAVGVLAPEGRLVCISFHSLEDRLVKEFFKECQDKGQLELVTKKVVTASEQELEENPSSRSAKLRAAQRV